MKTMTLNLTVEEMSALNQLSTKKKSTKTHIIRQALRLYQSVDADNGKMLFNNNGKISEVIVI